MTLPPIDVSGDNILQLPVMNKQEGAADRFLVEVPFSKCKHRQGPFEVDVDGAKCTCTACGETVSPFFVLNALMNQESRWMRTRASYQEEMKRLAERSRTKCRNCGEMTPISR
jgi:hypothetical protein